MKVYTDVSFLFRFLRVLFTALVIFFNQESFSSSYPVIAEAIIVRGRATFLPIPQKKALKLKKGIKIRQGTSIVTGKNSFVRLRFKNGSLISLGSQSKIVVYNIGKKKSGMVSLIEGKLRSKVEKKNKGQSFFVKTRTAALGVRGTEFQTIYNRENNVTSMLTYDGKVQVIKVDKNLKQKTKVLSKTDKEILENREIELRENLKSKNAQAVEKGQFVGVSPRVKNASFPVKISPVQFTALYNNDEMKRAGEISKAVDKNGKLIDQVEQKAPLEGFINRKTGSYAPRSGGFLDFKTGLYVPPSFSSKFNERLGVYEDKNIGNVNLKTGFYTTPKGLDLDPKKGFVLSKKDKSNKKVLKKKLTFLNRNMDIQSPLINSRLEKQKKEPAAKTKEKKYFFDRKELLKRNTFRLEVATISESLSFEDNNLDSNNSLSNSGGEFNLSLFHGGNKFGRLFTYFSLGTYSSPKGSEGSNLRGLKFGIEFDHEKFRYLKSSLLTLGVQEKFYNFFPSDFSTTNTTYLKRIFVPQLEGETVINILKMKRFDINGKAMLRYLFHSRTDGGLSAKHGLGFGVGLNTRLGVIPKKLWLNTYLDYKSENQTVNGPLDEFMQKRDQIILGLKLFYDWN